VRGFQPQSSRRENPMNLFALVASMFAYFFTLGEYFFSFPLF
jgi:hypothetical protein